MLVTSHDLFKRVVESRFGDFACMSYDTFMHGDMKDPLDNVLKQLRRETCADIFADICTRALYATDASIYQIMPLSVIVPHTREDVVRIVQLAAEHGVPILPRGAGTSLAGQTVGRAIHIDMSRHLDRILEVNETEGWVRVEPGVVLDDLNKRLAPLGLQFGPDVATSNRATLGGMISNNSSGARSIIHGKTADHILELDVVLADGSIVCLKDLDETGIKACQEKLGIEGDIYKKVPALISAHKAEIQRRYPKIQRRVSGYNLDALLNGSSFNLSRLIAGSEGTLAVITCAKLKVVALPKVRGLLAIHFSDFRQSLKATLEILKYAPSAVELLDEMLLGLARKNPSFKRIMDWMPGKPNAVLVVECSGQTESQVREKMSEIEAALRNQNMGVHFTAALDDATKDKIWALRKAGLPLLMGLPGAQKPIPFVEDTAVNPEHLMDFVERFRTIVKEHGTQAAFYAHASVGCLHIRPLVNLKDQADIQNMRHMAEQVLELVMSLGGAMSGEHGDGLARSCWNRRIYGDEIYGVFKEINQAFDPKNILNPGKITDAPDMTENLRYGGDYDLKCLQTHMDFSSQGGLAQAIELCNGAGVCRKTATGVMCPSYMATRDERYSTRGRANILRMILSGQIENETITSAHLREIMGKCLSCKACKSECPSGVDMAKIKHEFLAQHHRIKGISLRARVFGAAAKIGQVGTALAPFSNWVVANPLSRFVMDRFLGIDARRPLPRFVVQSFEQWFAKRKNPLCAENKVLLFHDCFMNAYHPEIGKAATCVLEAAGFEVLLGAHVCCGRPMISQGLLEKARQNAKKNVTLLRPYLESGIPLVVCEPSCLSAFHDEYPDLVGEDARALAEGSFSIEAFLESHAPDLPLGALPAKALYHGHCHEKSLVGTDAALAMLRRIPDLEIEEADAGCCGMAGAFGYEKEHYDLSMQIAEDQLLPAIQRLGPDDLVISSGTSCRQQISDCTPRAALHPIEVLARALPSG